MEIKLNAISHFVNMYASYFPFLQTSQTINQPTNKKREYRKTHSLSDETEWKVVKQV